MALTQQVKTKYKPTIGIECHVQLKTKTKLFAGVGNDARKAAPNTLISHICVGMPGALPVLNRGAIELSARAALALNTEPQKFSRFERKHYFYPDLPKGYQITQLEDPIIKGGYIEIVVDGQPKKINIERANLEEDAGKNTHPEGADYSLVDLNRAGTPLLEIVSKPELNSAAEAKAYARELWLTMKYADVTEGDLYHGHVRFDVNVSVSAEQGKLGTRSEIKNLNSFRSVEAAVNYEIARQIELLEKGEAVVQETRGWDEANQKSTSQRSKEEAEDYRYMPEPDVPPVELDEEFMKSISTNVVNLPTSVRQKLLQSGISPAQTEYLIEDKEAAEIILEKLDKNQQKAAQDTANWLTGPIQNATASGLITREQALGQAASQYYTTISGMLSENLLSSTAAKELLVSSIKSNVAPEELAKSGNLLQVSDQGEIEKIVAEVLAENTKAAEDVKKGEAKAIGFLVGQVMAKSKGKANPQMAQEIIKKQLGV
ncbi:MAG TPA: Asp-tRNA(Asn)/Glu-tRNA(Gln) amidotransferase subunit GatB [Candidatus Binatia bacterium]|nr:Asp-tRNA(Asn)/Glu-tRNA(Gln) amidotransferase subunit GatB [Candidatus Binatia bacterium]